MLGAIAGDIIGSYYEHSRFKFYDFKLFQTRSKFTDDTVMTIAVARWLVEYEDEGHPKDKLIGLMQELGREYPRTGYGYRFNKWLNSDNPQPYNSWGNGVAMRVSPVGLYAKTLDIALDLAKRTAEVSHSHPEGIKGAQAVASAVWMAKHGHSKEEIRVYITDKFGYDLTRTVDEIRPDYMWEISSQCSVPESIICFLEGKDFEDVVRLAVSLGGDADTMACIAGSIAACVYSIPKEIEDECKQRLHPKLYNYMLAFEGYIEFGREFNRLLDLL